MMAIGRRALLPLATTVLGAVVLASGALWGLEQMPVRDLRLVGELRYLSWQTVRATLAPQLRGGFHRIELRALRHSLEQLPWVGQVQLQRRWPGELIVRIREQRPVARWGGDHYISAGGALFRSREPVPMGLPLLSGPPVALPELSWHYSQLAPRFAAAGLELRAVALDDGCCWRLSLDSGVELVVPLGRVEDTVSRFLLLYRWVPALRESALKRVDLRYPNAMAVAWAGRQPANPRRNP